MSNEQNQPFRSVNKTMIEGSKTHLGLQGLDGKTKINLSDPSIGTSYPRSSQSDGLPTGNDPIVLGSGKVVSLLGTGGMAKVYKIWNEKLEVHRAVKIIIPGNQADLKSRFETEVKITAKLHHPNIVEIYSVGDWQELPYLEMEYIEGESLEAAIGKSERLPESVCSAIAIFVARALAYAHAQDIMIYGTTYHGIVHRDLKPANIMISKTGTVKLMDFGIARPSETSLHTVEGSIVGTLPYLAPEQIDGLDIDGRVDVYALGTILYEMLTGAKTFPQKSITNLMRNKVTNVYRKFDEFNFPVSTHLTKITKKCLQVAREERFADAQELLRALEAAHKAITGDSPEAIVKQFLGNPAHFSLSKEGKGGRFPFVGFLKPVIIIPAVAVLAVGIGLTVFLTLPKEETTTETTAPVEPATEPTTTEPVSQPQAMQTEASSEGMTPLGSAPATQQAQTLARQEEPAPAEIVKPVQAKPVKASTGETRSKTGTAAVPASKTDQLVQEYKTTDMYAIGVSAVQNGKFSDAITALEPLPDGHPQQAAIDLMLLESYTATSRTKDALYIVNSKPANSAEFELLAGKVYLKLNQNDNALEHFNKAMQKPTSIKSRKEVIDEALFNIAIIRTKVYEDNPTPDGRGLVMQSWFTVKQSLQNAPNDPRFKRAVQELAATR